MPYPVRSSGGGRAMRFRPPVSQVGAMRRERISTAIHEALQTPGMSGRLAVVTAPSGYGKTIAVADWARTLPGTVAWLTLSRYDADPGQLTRGIVHALMAATGAATDAAGEPHPTLQLTPDLDTPDLDDPADVYRAIRAALEATDETIVLVVDDAQRAGEDWQDGLLGALAEQPPEGLQLVIVGSTLIEVTLSRLALSHPQAFVGAGELAFDGSEIDRLRAEHGTSLDAATILDETQGWPIAVRLMLLGDAPTAAPGSREVALLRDYVRDHVLRALPHTLADFVLDTAVCGDVTAELAQAVTEREDAGDLLEECVRLGLFLDRFETRRGTTYRWHSVFARQCVAIAHTNDPDRLREMHRRAARHREADDPLAAMTHLMRSGDVEAGRAILRRRWVGLLVGPQASAVDDVSVELAGAEEDPQLMLIRACAQDVMGHHRVARELLARAESVLAEHPMPTESAITLHLARLFLVDDRAAAAAAAGEVRRSLVEADATALADRAAINYLLGWSGLRHRTDASLPEEYFAAAAAEARVSGDDALAQRALGHLAFAQTWAGHLNAAREVLAEIDADGPDDALWSHYAGGSAAGAAAYVAYWSGDLDAAAAAFGRVISSGSMGVSFAGAARMMRAYIAGESGDLSECRRAAVGIQEIPLTEAHGVSWPAFRESSVAMLEEAAGHADRAVRIARRYVDCRDLPIVGVAMAGVLRRAGDAAAALQTLRSLRNFADLSYVRVATLNTAAVLRREAGDHSGAHGFFETALEVAAAENIRLPYRARETQVRALMTDHIAHGTRFEEFIISTLDQDTAAGGLTSLTGREMSVYRQFRTSRTLGEIAAELGLSVNTVKTHQRSIYRKLGVTSRREAIRIDL